MPIPFILGAIAIGTAAAGVGAGVKGFINNSEANDINALANSTIDTAKDNLDKSREATFYSLEALGREKIYVFDVSIKRFIDSFEKLKNVDISDSVGIDEINKLKFDKAYFDELKESSLQVTSMLAGGIGGVGAGALAAFGAYSATMAFGAASTGTAIASLSGVAATNATLAFLGGGSLAAGGLGMAGGMAVLGGLVAGPALAVMGFVTLGASSKKLDDAYSNLAEANKISEELETLRVSTNFIRRRAQMFERLLIRVDSLYSKAIDNLEEVIDEFGTDYSSYSEDAKKVVASNIKLTQTIKAILDTPILTDNGSISEESTRLLETCKL
ncbi:hypothetical protein SZ40_12750 [Brachyspira hyodysenteriae]|uniref:hypothetical protein n=1 Tax=Brachyspira hyodysenteriae TaxID=159 RepID=UPI00063DA768|nr:hypothetical protein [Brachyspira hyodysenteriae]KLI14057.1 hypothetical protein SU44_12315 [Brachyspira hyodysenteriae]KLI41466.1 hypothetical protein SZ40_12750 [Brachyspira hyodysenteriae]